MATMQFPIPASRIQEAAFEEIGENDGGRSDSFKDWWCADLRGKFNLPVIALTNEWQQLWSHGVSATPVPLCIAEQLVGKVAKLGLTVEWQHSTWLVIDFDPGNREESFTTEHVITSAEVINNRKLHVKIIPAWLIDLSR